MSSELAQPDTKTENLSAAIRMDAGGLHTSDDESLYTVIGGRTFATESGTYMMPADAEEHRRLNIQHEVLRISLNGLFAFPELVAPLLREGQAEAPHILDIGTGSGKWALDMASAHPWSKVIGIDLIPPALISKDKIPPNCQFEIDDANSSLKNYTSRFDFVHARCISAGLKDANTFFYQVARTLKAGGVFLLIDAAEQQLRDENMVPFPFVAPGEPRFTWLQYIWGQARYAWLHRGCIFHKTWWNEWLESNPNYSEVRQRNIDIPIGPWKEGMTDKEAVVANMMRENISNVLESWRQLLLSDGHPAEDVNHWIEECREELRDMRVHFHLRFAYFAAVRSDTVWQDIEKDWSPPDEASMGWK